MAKVVFEHVSKKFGSGKGEVTAVNDLNIEVKDKEFLVLVGPSGCGKTTALRLVAGLEEITSGNIYIGERLVNDVAPKDRDIAMVFQSYALYPHMSVYDNLAFGLKLRKTPRADIERRVKQAADILQIGQLLDRKPKQLSGGQRQRVALGRAIVREPKVFLMDEPLSNLDAKLRVQTRAEISKLHQRLQTTIIYVTHDQVEAMTMGSRIAVMNGGLLHQLDTPQNLYDHPNNMFVAGFIGSPAMNFFGDDPNLPPVRLVGSAEELWADGGTFKVKIPADKTAVLAKHVNREVILGIRPEECYDRQFALNATADNTVKVTVDVVEPMGSEVYLYLLSGKKVFVGRLDSRTQVEPGQSIEIVWDMTKIHLFEKETQAALV